MWEMGKIFGFGEIVGCLPLLLLLYNPRNLLFENAHVSKLLNSITKTWNTVLLSRIFQKEEIQIINNIPLSPP